MADSNCRLLPCEGSTLATELIARCEMKIYTRKTAKASPGRGLDGMKLAPYSYFASGGAAPEVSLPLEAV